MTVGACMQALRLIADVFPSGWIAVVWETGYCQDLEVLEIGYCGEILSGWNQ